MNLIIISVLLVILAAGVVSNKPLSENNNLPEPTPSPLQTGTQEPSPVMSSTPNPAPAQTSTPEKKPKVAEEDWVYPNSIVVENAEKIILSSSDSTDKITDWYKSKIESLGFNVKSFVKTSANDVVKNVLSAAKDNRKVSVLITKNPEDIAARIEVSESL